MSQILEKRDNKLKKEISDYIVKWNNNFPIDYWWRTKYKVPFGSEIHRNTNFIQMFIDYEEEKMMNQYFEKIKKKEEDGEFSELGKPAGKEMSKKEVDDAFDNIDLTKYSKPS